MANLDTEKIIGVPDTNNEQSKDYLDNSLFQFISLTVNLSQISFGSSIKIQHCKSFKYVRTSDQENKQNKPVVPDRSTILENDYCN